MIPKYDEILIPVLRELKSGNVIRPKDLETSLADYFQLTEEEIEAVYPSGNGRWPIFLDRIRWAFTYLFIAELIERPQKGNYKISKKGLTMLTTSTEDRIKSFVKKTVDEKTSKKTSKSKEEAGKELKDERTPEEELTDSYERIKQNIQSQILTTILSKKPEEFERLVVMLLQVMGYSGESKDSAIVTKLSNDGGIDGIIKEDVLGFNNISIQAKRYALRNNVGRTDVQSFVGAVAATPSKKGVFITTSDYTKGAIDYVESLNGSPIIVLINGQQLTEYIYDYGLGLQTEKVLRVMKMDMDYWDAMDDV